MGELEGIGFFIEEIFSRIIRTNPEHDFYFITEKAIDIAFFSLPNVKQVSIKPLTQVNSIRKSWFNWRISSLVKKIKADVLISFDEIEVSSSHVAQCYIIHDVRFFNADKKPVKKKGKITSGKWLKTAVIVTASESLKFIIQKEYQLTDNNICIIPHPAGSIFQPVEEGEKENIKVQYAEGNEYFIYKASNQSGKKTYNLLKAFSAFKKKQKSNMKLLIAVSSTTKSTELIKQLQSYKYRDDVNLIEITNKQTLAKLVAAAYALIDLWGNEYFSYSGLEAIQCRTAAIVANSSIVSETEKDSFLYVNNDNFNELAEKMMLLYKDENLRSGLIENGKKNTSLISWDEAAKKMWDCILQTSVS